MANPLMKCGCVAQGVRVSEAGVKIDPPIFACLIHDCTEIAADRPDLTGRTAQCAYLPRGHAPKPSSFDLAFFEFRGTGSREATEICKRCKMSKVAHDENGRIAPRKFASAMRGCPGFEAQGPQEHDRYYCGCHGWD